MAKTLRLILGDQLNYQHSWFSRVDDEVIYAMMEILPETEYVTHHIQKVVGFFAAMRQFCERMQQHGHRFFYLHLDDGDNLQSFEKNILKLIDKYKIQRFEYLLPDEYRLDQQLKTLVKKLDIPGAVHDTEHFLTGREEVAEFFKDRKTYLMESFYRRMRRKFNILMEDDQPLNGRWNYDTENRRSLPKNAQVPPPFEFQHDVSKIAEMLYRMGVKTIGSLDARQFPWPLNRREALQYVDFFLQQQLVNFGTYQDAMAIEHPYLFHSRLSFALNLKMLHPLEVVQKTVKYWENQRPDIHISQIEGFVRQIIGWREFMRGLYWAEMPEYEKLNYFNHQNNLPKFYWTGQTNMNCLKQTIHQSLTKAYAHHIQRLMVTGNFANLAGVHPDRVDEWYLGIYIDALQWVEITNTRGMSQYADGGKVATKPYVASANYINKMSDYCKECYYDKSKRYGERACPFNSLYWQFYVRHRNLLDDNPRVGMMYRTLDKMEKAEVKKIREQAKKYRDNLGKL